MGKNKNPNRTQLRSVRVRPLGVCWAFALSDGESDVYRYTVRHGDAGRVDDLIVPVLVEHVLVILVHQTSDLRGASSHGLCIYTRLQEVGPWCVTEARREAGLLFRCESTHSDSECVENFFECFGHAENLLSLNFCYLSVYVSLF